MYQNPALIPRNFLLCIFKPIVIVAFLFLQTDGITQQLTTKPLDVVQAIADKVINQTKFGFKYSLLPKYRDAEIIDFGKNYGNLKPGFAYAISSVISEGDQNVVFEISHNDEAAVWINDQLVYKKTAGKNAEVIYTEKAFLLKDTFSSELLKGANKIFVQTGTKAKGDWVVYLQSASMKDPVTSGKQIYFSLEKLAPDIKISNWLMTGSFPTKLADSLMVFYPGQFYKNGDGLITWTIPKIEIVADVINGGEFYNWNYHVAGLMWAMQALTKEVNDNRYAQFSNQWSKFIIKNQPLIEHQVKNLHGVKSAFSTMIDRPMLDYTTAPALPFMSRLIHEKQFNERQEYTLFVKPIIDYAKTVQKRLSDGTFAREEPEALSVWVDDMFMGIPFQLFAAELTTDESEKKRLYNDAANQIISFNKHLFDSEINLYRHTTTIHKPENKYPHWSRANGWGLWASTEVLLRLPKQYPQRKKIMDIYKSHVDALIKFQNPETGFWRNVLDKKESKDETSGTAIFTMSIARGINNKWLSGTQYKTSVIKGWNALQTVIEKDGTVHGTVIGTNVSMDVNFYYNRPVADNDSHGLFPIIFAGIEINRMLNKQ